MATALEPANAPGRLFDDSFLRFLPAPVREPRRAWLAIPLGWLLSISGSLALAALFRAVAPQLAGPEFPLKGIGALLALVVFAPVVETFIMVSLIWLFERILSPALAILASAAAWGIAHSVLAAGWGLVIWWPFLIFSALYVVWRQRGFWVGAGVVMATHALQNLGPGLMVAFG